MTREEALDILGSYMTTNEKECWTPFDEGVYYAVQAIEKLDKIQQIIDTYCTGEYFKALKDIQEVLENDNR